MPHSHNLSHPTVTLSVRIPPESRDQLEELANATGRSKSFLTAEAIEYYLAMHSWQIKVIEKSIKKADSKKAKFFKHEKVADWLNSWGSENEQKPPK
jgi:RHH-type transcriptional regulator, rel operon repressor / antitoxin RelB